MESFVVDAEMVSDLVKNRCANLLFESGFFGGGVGIWDINHSDTRDGTIFIHGGWNLNPKLQFYLEGRLFMDMLDMIDNNYIYMGGIRYFFKN